MKLGIIGAMELEVSELKEKMEDKTVTEKAGMKFVSGLLNGTEVVVVMCSVGKVNAAICTQLLIDLFEVDAIVNTGIAGSLNAQIDIGDIVLSTDAVQHDMEVGYFGYAPGIVPGLDVSYFPADEKLRNLAKVLCSKVNPDIKVFEGRVVTGDQFISDSKKKEWLIKTFNGSCTEMEGAAIAQTAHRNKIPFLIIRAISDKADDSASMDYREFETAAARHSANLVMALAEELQ